MIEKGVFHHYSLLCSFFFTFVSRLGIFYKTLNIFVDLKHKVSKIWDFTFLPCFLHFLCVREFHNVGQVRNFRDEAEEGRTRLDLPFSITWIGGNLGLCKIQT